MNHAACSQLPVYSKLKMSAVQRAGQYKLLTAEEEKMLAVKIQHLADLKDIAAELEEATGAEATPLEVAAKAGISPAEYQVHFCYVLVASCTCAVV